MTHPLSLDGTERAFSSEAMVDRDLRTGLADRHAETPLLLALLGTIRIDGIGSHDCRLKIEAALREALAAPVAPFGYWHVGDTEEESEFFLHSESGDVSCETCVKLYSHPAPVMPPGYALVPVDALRWLHGEEGVFECPSEGYFRGQPAPYWWRKVFRKMCAAAPKPKEQTT